MYCRLKTNRLLSKRFHKSKNLQETILYVKEHGRVQHYVRYTRTNSEYHQHVHKFEVFNSKPTAASCNFYNQLPVYIKEIKKNWFFKRN
jgi:hypothetical protein